MAPSMAHIRVPVTPNMGGFPSGDVGMLLTCVNEQRCDAVESP